MGVGSSNSPPSSEPSNLPPASPEVADDTVFAKLYVRYHDELYLHLDQLLCEESFPGADDAVLRQADCVILKERWLNWQDKVSKGLNAGIDQKQSSPNQNFGAAISQAENYRIALFEAETRVFDDPVTPVIEGDPINRVGEHAARLDRLEHLLRDKVIPSVPPDGYLEVDRYWADKIGFPN